MVEYNKVNVQLLHSQVNKLKSAVKNQTRVTLRMSMKMFEVNNLPHNYYWQQEKTKLINAFENNMSTKLKLPKTQISNKIQSGGF